MNGKMNYPESQVPMLLIYKLMRLAAPVRGSIFLLLHHPVPVVARMTNRDQINLDKAG